VTDDVWLSGDVTRLGSQFTELAAALTAGPDAAIDPQRVVHFALRAVGHADHCGLTLLRRQRPPVTVAATDDLCERVDALQYRLREGPCLDAAEDGVVALSPDVARDPRWPRFGPACAREAGVRSVLSTRLLLGGLDSAALNLYSRTEPFDEHDVAAVSIFAPFASVGVQASLREQEASHFEAALSSSRRIGTAIGIIMARELVSSDEAFQRLRTASQTLNRKLRDIAEEVERTGSLPVRDRDESARA
jgi:hypothetical protein